VRWLRADYQITRFGSGADRARLEAEGRKSRNERSAASQGAVASEDEVEEMKPRYPTGDELAETAAVMRFFAVATDALTVENVTRAFAQGRQVEKRVASTVSALARLGHLATTDGGHSFLLRR
jgi:hypothetical protein